MVGLLAQVPTSTPELSPIPRSAIPKARIIETPHVPWSYLTPMLILMVGALVLLIVVALVRGKLPRSSCAIYTALVAGASLVSAWPLWHRVSNAKQGPISAVKGAIGVDHFTLFVGALICIAVILSALLADGYLRREGLDGPELYILMLLAATGGMILGSANDLMVMFLGIEILSIATYVMAAMHMRRLSSQEAGLKYFVLGAFSSAFLLYGIALVYGATGSMSLLKIQTFLSTHVVTHDGLLLAGLALMLAGFGFKIAAAPFHMWAPDVYQGAPSPVSAFMASGVKVAGFAGLLRVFVLPFGAYAEQWRPIVYAFAVLSLIVGSVTAIVQTNVKRALAYSSINHAGFILLGVGAASAEGTAAALFYLLCYTVMAAGSFGIITVVGRSGDGLHNLDDYKGLARSRPGVAMVFTVFLLAQAGTPFTAGFLAKFGVIQAAADRGNWWLALIAMLTAVISAFIYLRIVVAMYFSGGGEHGDEPVELAGPAVRVPWAAGLSLAVALVATVVLGFVPGPFTSAARTAVPQLVADTGR